MHSNTLHPIQTLTGQTNISSLTKWNNTVSSTSSYKPLRLQSWVWCGLFTSNTGRRLLLACNQTYLSLWHPGGASLMRRVKTMFLRKTEREEMDPKRGRAPLLSPGCDLFGTLPRQQRCQGSARLASFHLRYRCLCAAWLSPLSLPSKFRTWV